LTDEAIPKVGEYPAKTSSQQATSGNVFSEFGHAVYQSGIERPLTSLKQLVGMRVESAKPEPELHGAMEAARVVGSATVRIPLKMGDDSGAIWATFECTAFESERSDAGLFSSYPF
jgi:hypothetical protein